MNTNSSSPQSIVQRARQAYLAGDFPGAARAYAEAATAYSQQGDVLMAAEMKNNQSVSLLRAKEPKQALEALEGTERPFEQAGDFRRLGITYANRASALQALRRFKEAIQAYEKAAEALEKAGEDQMRLEVMQLLSMLYLGRWQFLNAVIALQDGLAGLKNPTPRQRLMKKILFFRP